MAHVHFDNIERLICKSIASAEKRVYIAVAWFTNKRIYDVLLNVVQRNIEVKLLILNDILNRNEFGLDYGELITNGAIVKYSSSTKGTMHNKFCVIDDKVVTGSYNWTYHANNNDENVIEVDDMPVVNSYCEQFEKLLSQGTAINLPYEHLKWTDIKEGDFSEARRNIYRDVITQNDGNRELKREKLIKLDKAYKNGDIKEIETASSLPTTKTLRSIMDVLTDRSCNYEFALWEENHIGKPNDNVYGYCSIDNWHFVPYNLKEDKYHREYIEGTLMAGTSGDDDYGRGYNLKIYDKEFIETIRELLGEKILSYVSNSLIPDCMLQIEKAQMFFYKFPSPMFNKTQPRRWKNTMPRTISAINLFGIVKYVEGENVAFYEGWDPQKRGEKIAKEFFVKQL